ncbi:MAG: carboxypeptidase regulatory-like domain-containing protein [Planctomycetes bacterium]|nr:carboxypeptidase regulatory-like domain-containing protein [Planctomycetota bacterium]
MNWRVRIAAACVAFALLGAGAWYLWLRGSLNAASGAHPVSAPNGAADGLPATAHGVAARRFSSGASERSVWRYGEGDAPAAVLRVLDSMGQAASGAEAAVLHEEGVRLGRPSGDGILVFEKLLPGAITVFACAKGLAPESIQIEEMQQEAVLRLGTGRAIRGMVLDRAGWPMGGARLRIAPSAWPAPAQRFVERTAVSSSDGSFEFSSVALGSQDLWVAAAAKGLAKFVVAEGSEAADLRLVMSAEADVRIRVVDSSRKPVAAARVDVEAWPPDGGALAVCPTVESGPDGNVAVPAVPEGSTRLRITAQSADFGRVERVVEGSDLWTMPLEVQLDERRSRLDVTVENARGERLPGVVVAQIWSPDMQGYNIVEDRPTGPDGVAVFDPAPVGRNLFVYFRWQPPGAASFVSGLGKSEIFLLSGGSRETRTIRLDVEPLEIRCVDGAGSPLRHIQIHVEPVQGGDMPEGALHAAADQIRAGGLTSEIGLCRLLLPSGEYRVEARHGARTLASAGVMISKTPSTLVIPIHGLHVLSGKVLSSSGGPCAGHGISAVAGDARMQSRTAADGSFSIPLLPEGKVRIFAEGVRGELNGAEAEAVLPAKGPIEIHLTSGQIEGSVLDSRSGEPVAAEVVLRKVGDAGGAERWRAAPDAKGRYRYPDLTAGRWRLFVAARGYLASVEEITLQNGATLEVPIRLVLGAHLSVHGLPSEAGTLWTLEVIPSSGAASSIQWRSDSGAPIPSIGPLAPGSARVIVRSEPVTRSRSVTLIPGEVLSLDWRDTAWETPPR